MRAVLYFERETRPLHSCSEHLFFFTLQLYVSLFNNWKQRHLGISRAALFWEEVLNMADLGKYWETPPMCLQMDFQLLSGLLVKILGEFPRVRNQPILSKKALAMAYGFKDVGFE